MSQDCRLRKRTVGDGAKEEASRDGWEGSKARARGTTGSSEGAGQPFVDLAASRGVDTCDVRSEPRRKEVERRNV